MRKKLPVLLLVLIILMQAFTPVAYAASKNEEQSQTAYFCPSDATSKGAGKNAFKSQELLDSHYAKHAGEFGNVTKDQYLKGAQNLVNSNSGGNILTKTRTNGDTIFYNKATNEFAVKASDGTIRTYFKPTDGINYFNSQK